MTKEQYNTENIHSTLICELKSKLDFDNLNVEDEYEIISLPNVCCFISNIYKNKNKLL